MKKIKLLQERDGTKQWKYSEKVKIITRKRGTTVG